jgi:hypothetical protein
MVVTVRVGPLPVVTEVLAASGELEGFSRSAILFASDLPVSLTSVIIVSFRLFSPVGGVRHRS